MAIFNLKKREIECKIVYYGPGRCGKTTNLEYVFKSYKKQVTGEMVSINTEGDRTLFFDFFVFVLPGVVEENKNIPERRQVVSSFGREIRAAVKRNPLRRDEHVQRPSALLLHHMHGGHVNVIDIRSFFPVYFDAYKVFIHQLCDHRILKTLLFHDMAPMTGRIAYAYDDQLVFFACFI